MCACPPQACKGISPEELLSDIDDNQALESSSDSNMCSDITSSTLSLENTPFLSADSSLFLADAIILSYGRPENDEA